MLRSKEVLRVVHLLPPWIRVTRNTAEMKYGGTELVVSHITEELVKRGYPTYVITTADSDTSAKKVAFLEKQLCPIVPWCPSEAVVFHYLKAVAWIVDHRDRIDVLHLHLSGPGDPIVLGMLGLVEEELKGLPIIVTIHSRFPFDRVGDDWEGDADLLYLKAYGHLVSRYIAISHCAAADINSFSPNLVRKQDVIYHGLPASEFATQAQLPGSFYFWVGRFASYKGAHLACEAAVRADVKLILAGVIQNPKQKEYFQKCIRPYLVNYPGKIRFIGEINAQQRTRLNGRARACLNPIRWLEPFGLTPIQAMSQGNIVMSFPDGAAKEVVPAQFCAHDVAGLVELIRQNEDVIRRSKNGEMKEGELDILQVREQMLNYCRSKFSLEKQVNEYLRVYHEECYGRQKLVKIASLQALTSAKSAATRDGATWRDTSRRKQKKKQVMRESLQSLGEEAVNDFVFPPKNKVKQSRPKMI